MQNYYFKPHWNGDCCKCENDYVEEIPNVFEVWLKTHRNEFYNTHSVSQQHLLSLVLHLLHLVHLAFLSILPFNVDLWFTFIWVIFFQLLLLFKCLQHLFSFLSHLFFHQFLLLFFFSSFKIVVNVLYDLVDLNQNVKDQNEKVCDLTEQPNDVFSLVKIVVLLSNTLKSDFLNINLAWTLNDHFNN